MHGLYTERLSPEDKPLSWKLARHICSHGARGRIVVVTDMPTTLLSATRKQWFKLQRQAQNEQSSTLNPTRENMLSDRILWMQTVSFTSKPPDDLLKADITFATADDFVRVPPVCSCVYITYDFDREKLHMLTAWLPRNALVVMYE